MGFWWRNEVAVIPERIPGTQKLAPFNPEQSCPACNGGKYTIHHYSVAIASSYDMYFCKFGAKALLDYHCSYCRFSFQTEPAYVDPAWKADTKTKINSVDQVRVIGDLDA